MSAKLIWRIVISIMIIGFLIRINYIYRYFDIGWEPDCYQHILFAQTALLDFPKHLWILIDVWAKPIYTISTTFLWLVFPRDWPLLGITQIVNSCIWMGLVGTMLLILKEKLQDKFSLVLVVLLMSLGFISLRSSVSALTEPGGALLVALSLFYWGRKRFFLSLLLIGFAPIARLDALLFVGIQWSFYAWHVLAKKPIAWRNGLPKLIGAGFIAFTPTLVWNTLGWIQSGHPLFILTSYPTAVKGIYGFGEWYHYLNVFWTHEPVLTITFIGGLICLLFSLKKANDLFLMAGAQSVIYSIVLSFLWAQGRFGTAGLPRYFVVAIPFMYMTAAYFMDYMLTRWRVNLKYAFVVAVVILGIQLRYLRPLYKTGNLKFMQWTSLRSEQADFALLKEHPELFSGKAIFGERPEVQYYLGLNHFQMGSPSQAADPNVKGMFLDFTDWHNPTYDKLREAFKGATPVLQLTPKIVFYERK